MKNRYFHCPPLTTVNLTALLLYHDEIPTPIPAPGAVPTGDLFFPGVGMIEIRRIRPVDPTIGDPRSNDGARIWFGLEGAPTDSYPYRIPAGTEVKSGRILPNSVFTERSKERFLFPSEPIDKSFPGFRLGGGIDLPLAVLFKEAPGYLSGGIETGWTQLTVSPSEETLSLVPVSFALMYQYPFETFLKGRFTLGAGVSAGGTAAIARETGFLFLIGPRLEAGYRLWDGKLPGSLSLGLGVDIIPQEETVILPMAALGLRLQIPLGTKAKVQAERQAESEQQAELQRQAEAVRQEAARQETARQEAAGQKALPAEIAEPVVLPDGRQGFALRLTVLFEPDTSALNPAATGRLRELGETFRQYPGSSVVIQGHTAPAGGEADRQRMSRERAQSVADFLIAEGYATADRIEVQGRGALDPLTSNKTRAGQQQNRRAIIIILTDGE